MKEMRSLATNFLVTGGAGFIGSNIVSRLLSEGHNVRILDNFSTGNRKNIEEFIDEVEVVEADIRDLNVVREAMKGVDYCLHHAALSSVERSIQEPVLTTEVNIRGTLNVLIAARDAGVKKVIFSSSSSIYGGGENREPISEDSLPNPLSPYAATKLTGEHYSRVFSRFYGMDIIILRYFNVFGPRQDPDSEYAAVIPRFIKAALRNEAPVIYGDGMQSRDFTYVDNVVEANILAIYAQGNTGESFNIATSHSATVNELWNVVSRQTGSKVKPCFASPRRGEVRYSLADISKARRRLGYNIKVDFEEGIARTIEYFRGI